jgi:hypothetical protein
MEKSQSNFRPEIELFLRYGPAPPVIPLRRPLPRPRDAPSRADRGYLLSPLLFPLRHFHPRFTLPALFRPSMTGTAAPGDENFPSKRSHGKPSRPERIPASVFADTKNGMQRKESDGVRTPASTPLSRHRESKPAIHGKRALLSNRVSCQLYEFQHKKGKRKIAWSERVFQ